ncbi:hypothetical protein [Acinetobacter proteolyticus]|uniref:Uncharacterized protein n=1 Tax=Acinetobacter proteolyticus TaxID=1776741 RepID=A0A2N0WIB7_9GAMM|nr:hypothetical protein [Acinetobacter proteolyticus]MBK5645931.1 hypothetical protein [Acinetobacter sp.]PKF35547.1 hypothetical protein CW311_04460 [Acinetobacter proteolyticus]
MEFTEYLFDKTYINGVAATAAASLKANRGFSNFEAFAAGVINRRLEKNPERYLDYGPYWPALKKVLKKHDFDFGSPVFSEVAEAYKGDTDLQTIVMADEFRKDYLATQFVGTRVFLLNKNSAEEFQLIDDDMELKALNA